MKPRFLAGIRLTDLTWAGAGPFGTKIFSDFGADVVKIESATRPDSVRMGGPFKNREAGINRSGYFASRNTGKKSVTVDLKTPEGREIVYDLVRKSDIVSNNFGPGAMERLGMGYETIRAIRPDIIYLSMPMYADSGPRASMLGVGMTISAVSGLLWQTAYGPDEPVGPGTHYPDHAANPYHAAFAVIAALRYRRLTGEGMKIDLSQVESTINFLGPDVASFLRSGEAPSQTGNRSDHAAPHDIYRCAGEDEWCAIAVETEEQWRRFVEVIEQPGLAADSRFETWQKRVGNRKSLDEIVEAWTSTRQASDVASTLRHAGVPAALVAHSRYLIEEDPQLAAREYWQRVDHPELGHSLYASPPYRIDGERVDLERPPLLGEHTHAVLSDLLGKTEDEIDLLDRKGVLR